MGSFNNEVLHCARDTSNTRDPYAVSVFKIGTGVVGHPPKRSLLPVLRGDSITCTITGSRQYSSDLPQVGMEIVCLLEFSGSAEDTKRIEKPAHAAMDLPEVQTSSPPAPNREQNSIKNAKRKVDVLDVDNDSPTEADNC